MFYNLDLSLNSFGRLAFALTPFQIRRDLSAHAA